MRLACSAVSHGDDVLIASDVITAGQFHHQLSHKDRMALGKKIPDDIAGVIYHPEERPSANCIAVLRSDALGRTVQTVHYRYHWNGERISSLYAFDAERNELKPEDLRLSENALVA